MRPRLGRVTGANDPCERMSTGAWWMFKKLSAVLVVAAATITLAGCGSDGAEPQATTYTAANGDEFNDADVSFATDMIGHHAQALLMVDMSMERSLDPEVAALIEGIRSAQAPEIETMVGWLNDWDKPIPETARDHVYAGQDGMGGMDMSGDEMPGMMSSDELDELEAASDVAFRDMWLAMMIAHHEGAIEMAQIEQADGIYPPAIDLAKSIVKAQQLEITEMEQMLGS